MNDCCRLTSISFPYPLFSIPQACTVPSSMSQTFGNEFGQQVLGNSTAFTGALTASAATQAISTPQQQAAYLDPYSSLSSNRGKPWRLTNTLEMKILIMM